MHSRETFVRSAKDDEEEAAEDEQKPEKLEQASWTFMLGSHSSQCLIAMSFHLHVPGMES